MRDLGTLDMLVAKEHFTMQMETSIAESGITINVTDMEYIQIKMKLVTKAIGKTICSMEEGKKYGLKDRNMKENMLMVKNTVRETIHGLTIQYIMESG